MSRIVGITGGMGSGKSTLARLLSERGLCRIVEVDDLRRHALWGSREPRHVAMRRRLAEALGVEASGPGADLDRRSLALRAFSGRDTLAAYAEATAPTLREDAAAACASGSGPAAIVWTRLAEDGYLPMVDGPVALLECPREAAAFRVAAQAASGGDPLTAAEASARMSLQATDPERLSRVREAGAFAIRVGNIRGIDPCNLGEFLVHTLDLPA